MKFTCMDAKAYDEIGLHMRMFREEGVESQLAGDAAKGFEGGSRMGRILEIKGCSSIFRIVIG